jgi:hypothetical protein
LHDGVSWSITAVAVSILALCPLRIVTNLVAAIILSIPIVELLTGFPSTLLDFLNVPTMILACICVAGAMVLPLAMFLVIRQIQFVHDMGNGCSANNIPDWRKLTAAMLTILIIGLSVFGWRLLLVTKVF